MYVHRASSKPRRGRASFESTRQTRDTIGQLSYSEKKPSLAGMNRAAIQSMLGERSDSRWRAAQIATWVYQKAVGAIADMSDLPKGLRVELEERFTVNPLEEAQRLVSSDGVQKLLLHGGDGEVFECVLLPYKDRVSCCLSSQVGCPMGCRFCATGLGGFDRNLSPGEIVGQYLYLQALTPRRISHVVFMGMGEPLLNLEAVVAALRLLHDEVELSYRHLTVSTVGIVPQIDELAKLNLPIHLALSLHSPLDSIRDSLMPVNKRWPVSEVMDSMRRYASATGRKITIEYLLLGGLTDTPEQATKLAGLLRGIPSVVNVIPFNYVATPEGFKRPERAAVRQFKAELESRGVNVTERVERGHDIAAACGQLAGAHQGRFAKRRNQPSDLPVLSS